MRRLAYLLLPFLLAASAVSGGGQQNQTSKSLSIQVDHIVSMSWTASTTPQVTSYNIYYSMVSGGPYILLQSQLPCCSFQDLGERAGTTVFYVATAVAPDCQQGQTTPCGESVFSNELQVTVPTP